MKLHRFNTAEEAKAAGFGSRPDAELAAEFGVTRQGIAALRKRYGIPPIRTGEDERIETAIRKGKQKPVPQLAAECGVSRHCIRLHARRIGVQLPKLPFVPQSRYTDADVIAAIKKAESMKAAAALLGTHQSNLYYMIRTRGLKDRVKKPDGRLK